MSVINHTPFPAMAFRQYNFAGELNGIVCARGTYEIAINAPLKLSEEQSPLILADQYESDPHSSGITAQSDLVPYKPGTDVTFQGSAFTPDRQPSASWLCGFRVGGLERTLRVHGRRFWEPRFSRGKLIRWDMTPAEVTTEVPLHWNLAWGGKLPCQAGEEVDVCRSNPLGCGIVDLEHCDPSMCYPAPQLEDPNVPISDWKSDYVPYGMGPIPPWWRPRQQYAGSYDENWRNTRHPLLPRDFDYRFYQCAPAGQIASPYLQGDESIELVHLTQVQRHIHTSLPGVRLRMRIMRDGGYGYADLQLDGVHFFIKREKPRVYLTWRASFPWPDGKGMPELRIVKQQHNGQAE